MSIGKVFGFGCLGLVGLAVIIGMISALGGGGGDSSNTDTASNTQTETQASDTTAPATNTSTYGVGDVVKLNDQELVVTKVDKNYSSGNQFDTPRSSENTYVLVNVSITNTGSSSLSVNPFSFKLEDETGTQRDSALAIADSPLQSVSLSQGGKTSGNIVFEAKKDSSTLKLIYSPGLFSKDVMINL